MASVQKETDTLFSRGEIQMTGRLLSYISFRERLIYDQARTEARRVKCKS